jgi:alpha-L-fucosidase
MKRRTIIKALAGAIPALGFSGMTKAASGWRVRRRLGAGAPFQPTWDSLKNYSVPEWFRDAKFGMWAHWGPQCQAEYGDWYARSMYIEGSRDYKYHVQISCAKVRSPFGFRFQGCDQRMEG